MKRISALLIAVLLAGIFSITAFAHEVPDLSRNGTITFRMDWNGEPLDSGSLSLYKVGTIAENDGDFFFELIDQLKSSNLSLENPDDPSLAKELAELAEKEALTEIAAPIADGKAVFSDVPPGLYVVVQDNKDVSDGFAAISPFLISMPRYENGQYIQDITAAPKVPLETAPTVPTESEPTQPTDSSLPRTGQLNWLVPVLAVSGLTLFTFGWILSFRRKAE